MTGARRVSSQGHHHNASRSAHLADLLSPLRGRLNAAVLSRPPAFRMPAREVTMTRPPIASDRAGPREWSIGNRTLIVSAGQRRPLAVLSARYPLLLPPGSVLQFDDGLDDQRVVGVRVIAGQGRGIVCLEVEPVAGARCSPPVADLAAAAGTRHLQPVRSGAPGTPPP